MTKNPSERCAPCEYADTHHWWGQPGAHCRKCHRSWTSTAQAHCTVCHGHFATNGVADKHWRRGVHVDPSTVKALRCGDDGIWHTAGERPPHWRESAA